MLDREHWGPRTLREAVAQRASRGTMALPSGSGKLVTILLMYVGRVEPLTFASAIALRRPTTSGEFRYAYEEVIIG